MPREKIGDPSTEGMYVEVKWRRHDEVPDFDALGYVQIATLNERADNLVAELLGTADTLLAQAYASDSPDVDPEWVKAAVAWRELYETHKPELTGWYVDLTPDTMRRLTRFLHRSRGQAYGHGRLPDHPETALRGLPTGAETEPCG